MAHHRAPHRIKHFQADAYIFGYTRVTGEVLVSQPGRLYLGGRLYLNQVACILAVYSTFRSILILSLQLSH